MLQQTRVDTVIPYYTRFLARFPTVHALAQAQEDEVIKLWEGLGYYSRARNLHKAAKIVSGQYDGHFPQDEKLLGALPGIGAYTVGAIRSIAYGQPAPAVDGNVLRVISRLHGLEHDIAKPAAKNTVYGLVAQMMQAGRCADLTQALMDLGAMVCTPGKPDCAQCPWQAGCAALATGREQTLPIKSAKPKPVTIRRRIAIVLCKSRALIRRRDEALLHGLWEFPGWEDARSHKQWALEQGMRVAAAHPSIRHTHVFTHRKWVMDARVLEVAQAGDFQPDTAWRWAGARELAQLAFPTAMRPFLLAALDALGREPSDHDADIDMGGIHESTTDD